MFLKYFNSYYRVVNVCEKNKQVTIEQKYNRDFFNLNINDVIDYCDIIDRLSSDNSFMLGGFYGMLGDNKIKTKENVFLNSNYNTEYAYELVSINRSCDIKFRNRKTSKPIVIPIRKLVTKRKLINHFHPRQSFFIGCKAYQFIKTEDYNQFKMLRII
jgi:hypothetical protein